MHKHTFLAVALIVTMAGCASTKSESGLGNAKVKLIEPEIGITQESYMPPVANHVMGPIPVHYVVRVANKSAEPITLTRIDLQSLGAGAYSLANQSRPFKTKIAPDHFEMVELWLPARVLDNTVYGSNGPVTLRAVAHFDSPVGQFDSVIVQQVHERPTDDPHAQ